jgi:hypothetical protein
MSRRKSSGLGPSPVFVYEWITSMRRWQPYALRSLFVLCLLVAVLVIVLSRQARGGPGGPVRTRALADVGERLFVAVVGTQLALVLLAAPAATAGSICLDRSRGTLAHLLVTDLTDREILLGKLAARLTPVLVLVAATLPVMELLTPLGGVDPDALLRASVVTVGVAVLGCCLALFFSIRVRRTHEALLATYAVLGLWLLSTPILDEINRATGLSLTAPSLKTDPFRLAFAPYAWPGTVSWEDDLVFLAGALGISGFLALLAVRTMRRVCTQDVVARGRVGPRARRRPGAWRPVCLARRDRPWISIPSCGANGTAVARRAGRGSSPWRSSPWHRPSACWRSIPARIPACPPGSMPFRSRSACCS